MNAMLKCAAALLVVGALTPGYGQEAPKIKPLKIPTLTTELKLFSLPGLNLTCTDRSSVCKVAVNVVPNGTGCVASIDFERVVVKKKDTAVQFVLSRGIGDAAVYEFHDEGIVFPPLLNPGKVPKDSLEFLALSPTVNPYLANWKSLRRAQRDLRYEPVVRRVSPDPIDCAAVDPMISNDGG